MKRVKIVIAIRDEKAGTEMVFQEEVSPNALMKQQYPVLKHIASNLAVKAQEFLNLENPDVSK
jgi:hypothetical protein